MEQARKHPNSHPAVEANLLRAFVSGAGFKAVGATGTDPSNF
jgi:hypothetical protein